MRRAIRNRTNSTTRLVDVGGVAEHIEAEQAEHRLHLDALQAVGAAGESA